MLIASHLICSTGIRFRDNFNRHHMKWIKDFSNNGSAKFITGRIKPHDIRIRADLACNAVPGRMKSLVLVNGNLSDFEMIQAAAEGAEKYADKIEVIPALLARLTYALEPLALRNDQMEAENVIFIVTLTSVFSEFVILCRDKSGELYADKCYMYNKPNECLNIFPKIYDDFTPDATIYLVHGSVMDLAREVDDRYRPINAHFKPFERWDFVLLSGGMLRAMDEEDGFDSRFKILNFANGIETISSGKNLNILLPILTRVPCKIYGFDGGDKQPIKIFYAHEYVPMHDKLLYEQRFASDKVINMTGSSSQVIGYYDARGVPYIVPSDGPIIEAVIDLTTGNILEYDSTKKTKTLIENVFKPTTINPKSSYRTLIDTLLQKSYSNIHVLIDKEIQIEHKEMLKSVCKNLSFIQKIKAELSYCFKEIENANKGEKIAVIFSRNHEDMDVYPFEIKNGNYYFFNRQLGLSLNEAKLKVQGEVIKNVFIFCSPSHESSLLDFGDDGIELEVKHVQDFKNIGLNGVFNMETNLKNLANTKVLKDLFNVPESGRTSRSASDVGAVMVNGNHQNEKSSQVRILFKDGFCAVEVYQNGAIERICNLQGNEWTPLYLSMAEPTPEIGEKAQNHYNEFPKSVVYDILKIIGRPLNKIEMDPNWSFELVEKNGIVYFGIETPKGPRLLPQDLILSAFFKAMKNRATLCLEPDFKEIILQTSFKLNESQEAVFKNAALKNGLEIISFVIGAE